MRKSMRRPVAIVLLAMVASLLGVVTPNVANAAESIPALRWSSVPIGGGRMFFEGGPSGSVTVGCRNDGAAGSYGNLRTYSSTGQLVRNIPYTTKIDGVQNCIWEPAIGKDGDVYGFPIDSSGVNGPNLLAYDGNTLKWKYPAGCFGGGVKPVVGVNGNVYTLTSLANGEVRLIGLTPEVEPGKTQPKKVLDVKVADNDCGSLHAFSFGVAVRGFNPVGPRYYGYSGRFLREADIGNHFDERFGAEGHLFVPLGNWTSSPRITRYSPATGTKWTYVFQSGTLISELHPAPSGGVVAVVTLPSGQLAFVVINPSGQKVREVSLPEVDSQGREYSATRLDVDTSGRVAVVRSVSIPTNGDPVSGIFVGAYNIPTSSWSYQTIMTGDLNKAGGPNGYNLDFEDDNSMALSANTIGIIAACMGNCSSYQPPLYAISVAGVGLDYRRGAVLGAAPRPPASYIALGDSYSSGEGVGPFEAGTAVPGENTCHRSEHAYARAVAANTGLSLGTKGFRACSGAETKHVTDLPQWNEGIQLDWRPDTSTQLVTITVGGNDIKFAQFAEACVLDTCQAGSAAYNESVGLMNALPAKLVTTYKDILAYAPNADVYVLGYPQVMANMEGKPFDARCVYMYNGTGDTGAAHYPWEDAWAARDIVTKLNQAVETAVTTVRNASPGNAARLHYVKMDGPTSPFAGHEMCSSGASYFQNLDQWPSNNAAPFHPNAEGQQAYATAVMAAINAA